MRIAYSCAGEGLGHATRTGVIGPILAKRNDIVYFIPSTVMDFARSRIGEGRYEEIPHFAFKKRGERVRLIASILSAIPLALGFPLVIAELARRLKNMRIDAVISDFDPFLPWAARAANIPILQINHPGIVQRVFCLHPQAWLTSAATRILEGPWNERIHISFYNGDIGPIIRSEVYSRPIGDQGFVLLNLKACLRPVVLPIIERSGVPYKLFPDSRGNFLEALATCSCVLSTAGHQIIAESLALNKPILVIPQRGQWEQQLNARMVDQTGKGASTTVERLGIVLPAFLGELGRYRATVLPPRFNVVDNTRSIIGMIEDYLDRVRQRQYQGVPLSLAAPSGKTLIEAERAAGSEGGEIKRVV